MSFFTVYQAKFTKPLVRQMVAVVQRDIQGALDLVSGEAGAYQPFIEYELAINPVIQPPMLVVAPRNDVIQNEATQQGYEQEITIQAEVWLANQDRNVLAEQIQDYVTALTFIFTNLGASVNGAGGGLCDFYNSLPINVRGMIDPATKQQVTTTTPLQFGSVSHCYVTEQGFSDMLRSEQNNYLMSGGLILSVGMIES